MHNANMARDEHRPNRPTGREIGSPMALVILGGLISSTWLNLLVLPTLALRYGRFQAKDETDRIEPE